MFDALSPPPVMERSHGQAAVALAVSGGATRLQRLRQIGSAKAILPRSFGTVPEVVFLNTSGGLTGGDTLEYALDLGPGAQAVATTQTAERAYARSDGLARVRVALSIGDGAHLDWLPQETILFNDAALHRSTRIDLSGNAGCLFAETVVLGRLAMGETLKSLDFRDDRQIWRKGRPVMIEPLELTAITLAAAGHGAILGGARAFATVVLAAQGAEDAVAAVRETLDETGVDSAASGFDGKCVVRLLSRDGWPLRRQMLRLLAVVQRGRALPRVWQI